MLENSYPNRSRSDDYISKHNLGTQRDMMIVNGNSVLPNYGLQTLNWVNLHAERKQIHKTL